jgi:hypothetical protein
MLSGSLIALVLAFWPLSKPLAHEQEPQLEIGAEELHPGDILEIRGLAFAPDEAVDLTLAGPGGYTSMGSILTDSQGGFTLEFVLPSDLAEGSYYVKAASGEHEIGSPFFAVAGQAVMAEETNGEWEEEDAAPATRTGVPVVWTPVAPVPEVDQPSDSRLPVIAGLAALAVLGAGVGLASRLRRRG